MAHGGTGAPGKPGGSNAYILPFWLHWPTGPNFCLDHLPLPPPHARLDDHTDLSLTKERCCADWFTAVAELDLGPAQDMHSVCLRLSITLLACARIGYRRLLRRKHGSARTGSTYLALSDKLVGRNASIAASLRHMGAEVGMTFISLLAKRSPHEGLNTAPEGGQREAGAATFPAHSF